MTDIKISQDKILMKTSFEFKEAEITYSYRSSGKSLSYSIDYIDVPNKPTRTLSDKYSIFRNIGVAALIIGLALSLQEYFRTGGLHDMMFLHIGAFCMLMYYVSEVKMSIFDTHLGGIIVLKDKNHDLILKNIYERVNIALKDKYAFVDFDASVKQEENKFRFLLDEGVISLEEYNHFIKTLNEESDLDSPETIQ